MKHLAFIFGMAALVAVSCSVREENFNAPDANAPVFRATFEQPADAGTKVFVNEDFLLRWNADDRVSLFNKTTANQQYRFLGVTGDSEGEFEIVGEPGTGAAIPYVISVYPYQESTAITAGGALAVTLPATQAYAPHSFGPGANTMAALSADEDLQFKNLGGYLRVSLYGAGVQVSSLTLQGNKGEKIAGKATVSMTSAGLPSVAMADDATTAITLTCAEPVALGSTEAESVDFWFVVPPVTFSEGFTVTVNGDAFQKATSKPVTIARNHLSKMAPVEVAAQPSAAMTFRISHLWLWGGTGPQYGGTKVIDLLAKPDYFNKDDGRGVTALADNYYVLQPDGTFVNYAGEDGRNWWFVYSGSVNPQNGKDLDLRKFYDVLPLSEGHFAQDGTTVTFTKADGSTTQATLVGPGTYDMPDTNPVKSVTIESQALMFTITGGVESWDSNIMYTDYHAIAGNPKALFIEMEVLPNGFVVPEASKTTDADFKYEPPSFDWTSLPGKWNVYGNNSTKDGLWVLGGSGSDPAFVSPIDKTWDWDGTIYKESDNELIIKVTGFTGTGATGTTNWWAGADGGFWDYIFKSTSYPDYDGTDLSRYYDQIPKGEKEFSVDIATQTVTLGNGHQAKFLTPGTHKFVNNKTLVIPTDCFGLQFHLNDYPVEKTAYQYKDIDRFLFAPLEYIIIFEKTE